MNADLDQIKAILQSTPKRWQSLLEGLPEELVRRRPAEAEWSAVECLLHLLDGEQKVFPVRVEAFLAGRDLVPFDPDREGTQPTAEMKPAALAAEFAARRASSLRGLERVTAGDLDRQVRHPQFGEVKLREHLNEWAAHDLDHTIQAERALMQPFIDQAGPWQGSFEGNRIK